MSGRLPLTIAEHRAIDVIVAADRDHIREAARKVPSYQRLALVWLAREITEQVDTLPDTPGALELMRSRSQVLEARRQLEQTIANSNATPQDRAFMAQATMHLWQAVERALAPPGGRR